MAIELQLKQSQALSQRVIQSVNILQMTSQQLDQYVNELALENPAMDVKDPPKESIEQQQWLNSLHEENHYLYQRQIGDDDYDAKDTWNFITDQSETLYDYLWAQLITNDFSPGQLQILDFMLQNLDDRGYLTESVSSIADYFHIDSPMVETLLQTLQSLEPVGVCARNLQECLKLQLRARGLLNPVLAQMVDECLDLIAKNKISSIARRFHLPTAEITGYCQIIRSLNPKPGSAFYNREEMKYIIPDVTIIKFDDHFDIVLNRSACPEITVNSYYQKMNAQTDDADVKEYLNQKIHQVEWVQQCIAQRGKTLMSVSREILKNQEDFFIHGPEHLHPLKLTDVSEAIGVHESTVSRAVDKKYLQCSWGVYPMTFFFQRTATSHASEFDVSNGQDFTNADVKRALREITDQENKKKPFSDRILSEMLAERGMPVSRRTVAKYRDEEGIPDASGRKFHLEE
ncbi:RNA polymerase factor sigma-54 [Enterocloster bolteae]|uniref:RNA polymerase factor sigma-54 n=1 Tax=Enterocloster bolteae TaxID=208479 RepID=UPI0028DCE554|nr:RNA polymerase factor sigma-54 [Enterocloster bolteae]